MKILKKKNYNKFVNDKKNQGCRECGNLSVGHNGLCQKCQEEEERRRERYRTSGDNKRMKKKALDMNRYESQGMMGENGYGETDEFNDRTDDFDKVQGLIDKYNSYGPGAFSLKEEPLGSEFYSLIKADSITGENPVVITQGDLFDIEDRMKQIIREHGLTNL